MNFTISKNTFASPWNGLDPCVFHVTGAPPKTSLTFSFPVNIVTGSGGGIAEEGINTASTVTDENGNLDFVFNGDPNAAYLKATIANGWVLPAGSYQFGVRVYSITPPQWTYADFQVTGLSQATLRNKKPHGK